MQQLPQKPLIVEDANGNRICWLCNHKWRPVRDSLTGKYPKGDLTCPNCGQKHTRKAE